MSNTPKTTERLPFSKPDESRHVLVMSQYRHCLAFLKKTSCEDDTCAVHAGTGTLCPRHSRSLMLYRKRLEDRRLKYTKERNSNHSHGGSPNSLCLACFTVNRHCHCPKDEDSVISIGTKFRTPTRSTSKRMWLKELEKLPHILSYVKYPKDQIGCRYVPVKSKKVKA